MSNKLNIFIDEMLCFLDSFTHVESTLYDENLTFSNTQTLDNKYKDIMNQDSNLVTYLFENAPNASYPPINSKEGKKEIKDLFMKSCNRTTQMYENILLELSLDGILQQFNIKNLQTITALNYWFQYINPVIIKLKVKYDRVRPSLIDTKLSTLIDVPDHPAFPSGHASQSYFIAYFLSYFFPNQKEFYLTTATNIATNREYAGVHYSSDTAYGKQLGKYFADTIYKLYYNKNNKKSIKVF